jgi:hypothetical protein
MAQSNTRIGAGMGRLASVALLGCLVSCASLSPQQFSDQLLRSEADAMPRMQTVREAKQAVANVQRKYLVVVSSLSNTSPRISSGLIGLSAYALFLGLTQGNSKDIATAGVAGSAVWAYGASMASRPRQLVYLEGTRALSCSVMAAEPYDKDPLWRMLLDDNARKVAMSLEQLRAWRVTNDYLISKRLVSEPSPRPADCARMGRPACPATGNAGDAAGGTAADCRTLQKSWDQKCTQRDERYLLTAAPEIMAGFDLVEQEMQRSQALLLNTDALTGRLEMAGAQLWEQAVAIQLKVSAEVLKTEPDPTAVLGILKNLNQVAGMVGGADWAANLQADPAGTAHAGGDTRQRSADAAARAALDQLNEKLSASYAARIPLQRMLAHMDARVAAAGKTLKQCEFTPPGISLSVLPAADEIQVAGSQEQQFFVSGGSGIPIGRVVGLGGAQPGTLQRSLDADAGSVRFVYRPAKGAANGDRASIQFTDGSGQASHFVTMIVTGVATDASLSSGTSAPRTAARGTRLEDLGPADFEALALDRNASPGQFEEAVRECQQKLGKPSPVTGSYDRETQAAALSGGCRAGRS